MKTAQIKSFITILLLFSCNCIFSQNHSINFDFALEFPCKKDLKGDKTSYIVGINYNWKDLQLSTYSRLDSPKYDITAEGQYLFNYFSKHNIGVFGKYHFYLYEEQFFENDGIYGVFYQLDSTDKFNTIFYLGHFLKWTNFINFDMDIFKKSLYGAIILNYNPIKSWNIYTTISTCDTFEFLTFGSLFINTGIKYDFTENLATALSLCFKLVDAFTVSTHLATFKISPTLKITI